MTARIHRWHGFETTGDRDDAMCMGWPLFSGRTNGAGEDTYRHFDCWLNSADYEHSFKVTVHTSRYRPYFTVSAGWR